MKGDTEPVLKMGQTGFWKCTLMMVIVGCLQRVTCREISREDAFVGYSEKEGFNSGLLTIQQNVRRYAIFSTEYGEIKVKLAEGYAPLAVHYIQSLISRGSTKGCAFYRAEPSGPTIDDGRDGFRDGYALIQGGLYTCGRQETNSLPVENALNLTKGSASLITGTSEFFFSIEAHPEWDGLFSVWGEVEGFDSWRALYKMLALPTKQERHSSGTVLRMLQDGVTFEARLE